MKFLTKHFSRKSLVLATSSAVLALGAASPAHAALQISFQLFNSADVAFGPATTVIDNQVAPGDANPALNTIRLGGVLPLTILDLGGGQTVTVDGSVHRAIYGEPNLLTSTSLAVVNNTNQTIRDRVTISATGYGPFATLADFTASGTWQNAAGSSITLTYCMDAANGQGAETATDCEGTALYTTTINSTGFNSLSDDSGLLPVNMPGLYSMSLMFDIILSPGASLISRGQGMLASVPEPGSLLLLGAGLAGFGFLRRSKAIPKTAALV